MIEKKALRAILDSIGEGVVVADTAGRFLYVNAAAERILGIRIDDDRVDVAGGPLEVFQSDGVTPLPPHEAPIARAMRGLETNADVYLRRRGETDGVHVSSTGRPLHDEAGNLAGGVVVFRDITKLKTELRASEDRFEKLARSGVVGVVIAQKQGPMLEVNDAFAEMVGYTREELLSPSFDPSSLTPADLLPLNDDALDELRRTGVARPWEKAYARKDGTRVPVLVCTTELDDRRFLTVVSDLTARKRVEAALARTEEQLFHAQKMEAIGRLAGGLAHDFNNILSVIVSYSELMLAELDASNPMRGDASEIRTAALRAAELTRQLLAYSRRQILAPTVLDVRELVVGMERMLRRVLGEDVELHVVGEGGSLRVKADAAQLEQVILNLTINARDAMPEGGHLTLEIADVLLDQAYADSHADVTPGPHVMLAVSDSGTGMDAETKAHIFEPFFTTKSPAKGTGLGLSTVYGIVKQSGGHIWVYSEPGSGTTFKIYLPATTQSAPSKAAPTAITNVRGSETILLVEDDAQVRGVVRSILARHGYSVLEADGGEDAIRFCARYSGTIHLLLTDVVMPKMSGRQLAETLAAERPDMKVVYMSGYTENTIVHHGVLEDRIDFLPKPVTPSALTRKIREVLDRPKA